MEFSIYKKYFKRFDELWIIGPRSDLAANLIRLGVVDEEKITLVHSAALYGNHPKDAKILDYPHTNRSTIVESIFNTANNNLLSHIDRVIDRKSKVCVFMPFPNRSFQTMLTHKSAHRFFTLTAPIADPEIYTLLESKSYLPTILSSIDQDVANSIAIESVIIENTEQLPRATTFLEECDRGVYIQKDFSAGCESAFYFDSDNFNDALHMVYAVAKGGKVKITRAIENAYPANGSACIIPNSNSGCQILIDPLSHKITAAIHGAGITGNDWTETWPKGIVDDYIRSAKAIGEFLYSKFGYTGIFGPDYVIENPGRNPKLKLTEINPRLQGTTPYQTYNSQINNDVPLEILHYLVKVTQDYGSLLDHKYNNTNRPYNTGCFYLKSNKTVDEHQIVPLLNSGVAIRQCNRDANKHQHKILSTTYISGVSSEPIFSKLEPKLSYAGRALIDKIYKHEDETL